MSSRRFGAAGLRRNIRSFAAVSSGVSLTTPDTLSSVVRHYRADEGITIGTGVSSWVPRIGSGTFTQGTASVQPAFTASNANFNGEPTVNGVSSDELTMSAELIPTGACTVVAVARVTNGSVYYWAGQNRATTGHYCRISGGSGSPADSVGIETSGTTWQADAGLQGTPTLFATLHDGAGTGYAHIEGAGRTSGARANPAGAVTSAAVFSFGGGGYAPLELADLMVCNEVLSEATMTALYNDYYSPRYGI